MLPPPAACVAGIPCEACLATAIVGEFETFEGAERANSGLDGQEGDTTCKFGMDMDN